MLWKKRTTFFLSDAPNGEIVKSNINQTYIAIDCKQSANDRDILQNNSYGSSLFLEIFVGKYE